MRVINFERREFLRAFCFKLFCFDDWFFVGIIDIKTLN